MENNNDIQPGQLLGLGGGPGTHAVHFCLANRQLVADAFPRAQ